MPAALRSSRLIGAITGENSYPKIEVGAGSPQPGSPARCRSTRDLASKKIMLGVLDLGERAVEPASVVADRIRNGLKHVPAERLVVAPDCGMKYMPRHIAFGKLKAMCDAAAAVRKEIG
jgi:methionine synthase II (cobalamin-independent)